MEGRFVKSVIAASVVVFLMAGSARAQLMPPCKNFDRSSTDGAPQFVRDYLDDPTVLSVGVCSSGGITLYYGAGNLVRDGNVCRYSDYELTLSPASPPRLERKATRAQTYMLISESSTCPSLQAINYTATNDVPQDVFVHLARVWHDALSSPESFDRMSPESFDRMSRAFDPAVPRRLKNAILQGKSDHLSMRIVTVHGNLGLWKSYMLDIADPDQSDRFYAVIVSSWFGQTYGISAVYAGIY